MKLRTFLMVVAVVALLYALGLLLFPAFMATTYGFGTSASEILLARFFGGAMLALGLITWLSIDLTGASVKPLILGSLIADLVGAIVALMGTLGGVMSAMGWSAFGIYLVFVLGFAYFQFMAPPK
jgi:hypothetical protein